MPVWVFHDEWNSIKVFRGLRPSKVMVTCYSWKNCTCTTRRTQNSQFWAIHKHLYGSCLQKIRKTDRWRRISLQHDNVSSFSFLSTQNTDLIINLPYGPDLASNLIITFPYVGNKLKDQFFTTTEEAVRSECMF